MIYYVAHKYGGDEENVKAAKDLCHALAKLDPENVYLSPLLAFGHLAYNELGYEQELGQCLELMQRCDMLVVGSALSEGVRREIALARKLGIPIMWIKGREQDRAEHRGKAAP